MKLLVIADEIKSQSDICSFTSLWNWYVVSGLRNLGAEILFAPPVRSPPLSESEIIQHYQNLPISDVDHVIALGHRYFERIPKMCASVLMQRCRGLVTQTHEKERREPTINCTFTMTEFSSKFSGHNFCVGWAADAAMLWSEQDPYVLRILVDHPERHHDGTRADISTKILRECLEFADSGLWQRWGFRSIKLRRLIDRGIEDFDTYKVPNYQAEGAPFSTVCEEYRKTHLFMVTHRETCGFSVIETAMAGGLPVVPVGFVPRDRLATIRHVDYDRDHRIPWDRALDCIDPKQSQGFASSQSWSVLSDKMMSVFGAASSEN